MWKIVLIQSLIFFLFFQSSFITSIRKRRSLLLLCGTVVVVGGTFLQMDPFVVLLYLCGVFLTYWIAGRALKWVFAYRAEAAQEAARLLRNEEQVQRLTSRKQEEIQVLQNEIQEMSEIYEGVKQMSESLEMLDIFVKVSEALIKNFSLNRVRLLLLKNSPQGQKMIDKVFHVDASRLEMRTTGRAVMTNEVMFQGEAYPVDLKLIEMLTKSPKSIYLPGKDNSGMVSISEMLPRPAGNETLIALPVKPEDDLEAILIIEGVRRKDFGRIAILTDRFVSEYKRIDLYHHVERLATTDWLTGLNVRRYFFKRLEEEIGRCERYHLKFSFLMIDIDDFKSYNDRYGHLVGDALLKKTAAIIKQNVREVDLVGRFGGEEFAAILLDTDAEGAMFVGQRIRKNVESEHFKVYDEEIKMTLSIGVATYNSELSEGTQIVEWADSALYQAKHQGKNRVCAYGNE